MYLSFSNYYCAFLSTGPFLYYVSKGTGWVGSEKWQFLLTYNTIYADVGWVGKKKSKNSPTYYRDGLYTFLLNDFDTRL